MSRERPQDGAPMPIPPPRMNVTEFFTTLRGENPQMDGIGDKKYGIGFNMEVREIKVLFLTGELRGRRGERAYYEKRFPTIMVEKKRKHRKKKRIMVEEINDILKIFDSIVVIGVTKNRGVALTLRPDGTYDYEQTEFQSH